MIASYLGAETAQTIAQQVRGLGLVAWFAEALQALGLRLIHFGRFDEAIATLDAIATPEVFAHGLVMAMPELPTELRTGVAERLAQLRDVDLRTRSLAAVCQHLPPEKYEHVFEAILRDIQRIVSRRGQAASLTELAKVTPPGLWPQLLTATSAITNSRRRSETLLGMLPSTPPALREDVLHETLASIAAVPDNEWQLLSRISVLQHVPLSKQRQMWNHIRESAKGLKHEQAYANVLVKLIRNCPSQAEAQSFERHVIEAVQAVSEPTMRASYLVELLPLLSPAFQAQIADLSIAMVQTVSTAERRDSLYAALTLTLARAKFYANALLVARSIDSYELRLVVLKQIIPLLPKDTWLDTAAIAQRINDKEWQIEALVRLGPYLTADNLARVVQLARRYANTEVYIEHIQRLAPYFTVELVQETIAAGPLAVRAHLTGCLAALGHIEEAVNVANSINDRQLRLVAMRQLFPHLPTDSLNAQLQALATTRQDDEFRLQLLVELIPLLPLRLLGPAQAIIHNVSIPAVRTGVFRDITEQTRRNRLISLLDRTYSTLSRQYLNLGDINSATRFVDRTEGFARRSELLTAVASELTPQQVDLLLKTHWLVLPTAWKEKLPGYWTSSTAKSALETLRLILTLIHPHNPERAAQIADDAIERAVEHGQPSEFLNFCIFLMPYFSDERRAWALDALDPLFGGKVQQMMPDVTETTRRERFDACTLLLPHCDRERRAAALQTIVRLLENGLQLEPEHARSAILAIAPYANKDSFEPVTILFENIADDHLRATTIKDIIAYLPPGMFEQTQEWALAMLDDDAKCNVLTHLITVIPEGKIPSYFQVAYSLPTELQRQKVLNAIGVRLALGDPVKLAKLWRFKLRQLALGTRTELMLSITSLLPMIHGLGGPEAVNSIAEAIIDVGLWFE